MKILSVLDQGTRRLCVWLGRYGKWSRFLDSIGRLVCPALVVTVTVSYSSGIP